jgi:hypothetical protein
MPADQVAEPSSQSRGLNLFCPESVTGREVRSEGPVASRRAEVRRPSVNERLRGSVDPLDGVSVRTTRTSASSSWVHHEVAIADSLSQPSCRDLRRTSTRPGESESESKIDLIGGRSARRSNEPPSASESGRSTGRCRAFGQSRSGSRDNDRHHECGRTGPAVPRADAGAGFPRSSTGGLRELHEGPNPPPRRPSYGEPRTCDPRI